MSALCVYACVCVCIIKEQENVYSIRCKVIRDDHE